MLLIAATDVSGLGALATAASVNLSTQASGTLSATQFGALIGDVSNVAGTYATTITAGAVTNTKLAQMSAFTFKGNATAASANPTDLTIDQMQTALLNGRLAAANLILN